MGRWRLPVALALVLAVLVYPAGAADTTVPIIPGNQTPVPVQYKDVGGGQYAPAVVQVNASGTPVASLGSATNLYADKGSGTPIAVQSGSATQLALLNGNGSLLATGPGNWSVVGNSGFSTATQATVTKAAGGAGVRHVATGLCATVAAQGSAVTPIGIYLRDGATGAGTILFAAPVAAPVNSTAVVCAGPFAIVGSANTAMTLEFNAAGAAGSIEAVTLTGFDAS